MSGTMRPMGRGPVVLVVAAAMLVPAACTTVLYKGPKRPASRVAVLVARETVIERVDELGVRDAASGSYVRFEVLPGLHEVGISLNRDSPGFGYQNVERSRTMVVCVELEAG